MEKWKNQFTKRVLERGKKYYDLGLVSQIRETASGFEAEVIGERPYQVAVQLRDGQIKKMHCSCPYAEGGMRCKHMAATMMKYEELQKETVKEKERTLLPEKIATLEEKLFSKEEEEPVYSYLDLEPIIEEKKQDNDTYYKALQLVDAQKVAINKTEEVYESDTNEPLVKVYGVVEHDGVQRSLVIYLGHNSVKQAGCTCPGCYYSNGYRWGDNENCEHIVALLLVLKNFAKTRSLLDATDYMGNMFLDIFQGRKVKEFLSDNVKTDQLIMLRPKMKNERDTLRLSFRVGTSKLYVVKNLSDFMENVEMGKTQKFGKTTVLALSRENFDNESKEYLRFIRNCMDDVWETRERVSSRYSRYYWDDSGEKITGEIILNGKRLDEFFEMVHSGNVTAANIEYEVPETKKKYALSTAKQNPKVRMQIKKQKVGKSKAFHGITVHMDVPEVIMGREMGYYFQDAVLCQADQEYMDKLLPFFDESDGEGVDFQIGRGGLTEFYYNVLPQIEDYITLEEKNKEEIASFLPQDIVFSFYLDLVDSKILCRAFVNYGESAYPLTDVMPEPDGQPKEMVYDSIRLLSREMEITQVLGKYFDAWDAAAQTFFASGEENIYALLDEGVSELLRLGEVQTTEAFRHLNIQKKFPVSVGVSVSNGLLELEISSEGIETDELLDLLASYRKRKKYYRLKNGSFLNLEDSNLKMLEEMKDTLQWSDKDLMKGNMKIPMFRALYLDKLLEENESVYEERDTKFKQMVKEFKTVSDSEFQVPSALGKTMRNYQKTGYKWMRTLAEYGFGGILCDDMGLGKTLQMIAVLTAYYNEQKNDALPSLVVCPASLVFNWGEELARFAPELSVCLVQGTQEARQKLLAAYEDYQVFVTSYDLLKRDAPEYEGKQFAYEVIDEAQYIKNHTTAAAKAVKVIQSGVRFALTGTPIENRLSELWSIFDYLMPGFLFRYETFKKKFETPIVKNKDADASDRLKKMVSPFLLRRLKENVLKDLPEKLEEIRYAGFDSKQQTLYDAQVVHLRQMLAAQKEEDFNKNKLQVLAELTKLRQICCDPSLCFENYDGKSAKREAALELISSAVEGGHRILLFSQFTSMLDLLKQDLQKAGIEFYEITGATPKERRLQLVKKFNQGNVPLFLISLKAGGTGLNLTGADMVIHYDPWWNLAAQNQATDRAHRIGQEKVVTVYRLIVKHTIEEKIVKIQESKKNLADEILSGETTSISQLGKEEFLALMEG